MPVIFQKWITREDVKAHPDWIYVFGDNVERVGFGGQAREMRGEPNTIGVATKWVGNLDESSFFSDDDLHCTKVVVDDLVKVYKALLDGKTVVIPEDGLGTGLSQLPNRAPELDALIKRMLYLFKKNFS